MKGWEYSSFLHSLPRGVQSTERETRYYIDKDYYVLLQDNAEFLAIGVRLKELFDGEFKNAFSIHEDAELWTVFMNQHTDTEKL